MKKTRFIRFMRRTTTPTLVALSLIGIAPTPAYSGLETTGAIAIVAGISAAIGGSLLTGCNYANNYRPGRNEMDMVTQASESSVTPITLTTNVTDTTSGKARRRKENTLVKKLAAAQIMAGDGNVIVVQVVAPMQSKRPKVRPINQ
ncbi:MAG: hypothetical protein HQK53_11250 [Oligoflexia bacterium]|nr:hypothetical protein [Oligoflexia bacterium]